LGARRLHLLSGETVHLGRNRENEAVLRCLDTEGNLLRGRSLQISGSHATIRRNGGTAVCADHSSNGSLLDGESLHQAETPLTAGEEHRLGLGLCDGDVALSLCLHPFGCAVQVPVAGFCPAGFCDRRQASGVFLGRRDEVPEDYALVWCHVGLASCRPGWPDLSIWRIDGAFAWRSERGTGWLVPDLPLPLPDGGACPVEAFNQFGLQSSQSQENRSGENKR
jgi:hypothetical protein